MLKNISKLDIFIKSRRIFKGDKKSVISINRYDDISYFQK